MDQVVSGTGIVFSGTVTDDVSAHAITKGTGVGYATISGRIVVGVGGLTLTNAGASGLFTASGGVTGTGDLVLNANSSGAITLSTNSVNNQGTITNSGVGTGATTLTTVGSNVTSITENSTTSALTVATLNVNAAGTTLSSVSGAKVLTVNNAIAGTGNLVLNNNVSTAGGITLIAGINNIGTVTNSGAARAASRSRYRRQRHQRHPRQPVAVDRERAAAFAGGLNITAGTVQVGNGGADATLASSGVTLSNHATLAFNQSDTPTYAGNIAGTGQLVEQGGGALTLTGSSNINGRVSLSGGSLYSNNSLTAASLSVQGGYSAAPARPTSAATPPSLAARSTRAW